MRLSDAIALGRTLLKPRAGSTFSAGGYGCANGMALAAIGKSNCRVGDSLDENFPIEAMRFAGKLPCGCLDIGGYSSDVGGVIAHLFDTHVMDGKTWTLDELIDWVRSVEPPEQEVAEPLQEVAEPLHLAEVDVAVKATRF